MKPKIKKKSNTKINPTNQIMSFIWTKFFRSWKDKKSNIIKQKNNKKQKGSNKVNKQIGSNKFNKRKG